MVDRAEIEEASAASLLRDFTQAVQYLPRPEIHNKRLWQLRNMLSGRATSLLSHTVAGVQEAIDAMLAQEHYDAVFFDSVVTAGYRLPDGVKVIIGEHNIEYEVLQRTYLHEKSWARKWYNWWEYRRVKPFELACCRNADVILVTSERERLLLKSVMRQKVIEVVPNGVDLEMFQDDCVEQECIQQIIFTGSMDYYPNADGVLFFAQKCWPLIQQQVQNACWQIVGRNPPSEVWRLAKLPGVTVTGTVPDTRPYFRQAAVAIVPLQVGGGTRLKILEALAMGKAVVSTSLGAEGLAVVSGKHLLVEDQPEAFVQAVVELMQNTERRRALGEEGRLLVENEYSWEACGDQLLRILDTVH